MTAAMCKAAGSLCWYCRNAYDACSWSRDGTPVHGWAAVKDLRLEPGGAIVRSFTVLRCPAFLPDHRFDREYPRFLAKTQGWRDVCRESDSQLPQV